FPPVWLREPAGKRTLMWCLEHTKETNYLSIFDPRTIGYYDHFYKNLHEHFGERIDDVYACILGPYGEGNYSRAVPGWVNRGQCPGGYWCGDYFAIRSFKLAMTNKYGDVNKLNDAWGTKLTSFAEVRPPQEISQPDFRPSPRAFPSPQDKRRWLDF